MNYPEQLLPKLTFKEITENLAGYFICRKAPLTVLQDSHSLIIREDLVGIESASDCFDYSTNLPGVFKIEHNTIDLIGENKRYFRTYWDWVSSVKVPAYQQDFELNKNVGCFFLQIDKINGITIPFNKKVNTPADETAHSVVLHTPTNSNFWHFSIKWKDSNGFISSTNSKWKANIIATIRALLSENVVFDEINQEIKKDWYIKN